MSRAGDEMILALSALLNTDVVKTAAKKDDEDKKDEKKEDKKEKKDEKKEDKKEKKDDDKEDKKEKKEASVVVGVLQDLVKLASELDDMGADEASSLVDEALRVIVQNIEKKKIAEFEDEMLVRPESDYEEVADVAQTEVDMEESDSPKGEKEFEGENGLFDLVENMSEEEYQNFLNTIEKIRIPLTK